MIIQLRQFINCISSLSPSSSSTTSGFISRGLFCCTTALFTILLLIVLSSSSSTLYFDYDNNLDNQNVIYSDFFHTLQKLDEENKKINFSLSMGRFYCDDRDDEAQQQTTTSSNHGEATFDNPGVSFGFVYAFPKKEENNHREIIKSISVDFSFPLFSSSPLELYPEGNASSHHQPHAFNAYILGYQSVSDLPSQPDLPFALSETNNAATTSLQKSPILLRKKVAFTTESFRETKMRDGNFASVKLFDADQQKPRDEGVVKPNPRVFLVWIVKATEPNFNRREFDTKNVVKLHRFRLKKTKEIWPVSSFLKKQSSPTSEEIIHLCSPSQIQNTHRFQNLERQLSLRPTQNQRRIEFFGDSITAGMCNVAKGTSTKDEITGKSIYLDEDFTRSWPFLIGQKLGARVHASAWSGIGLVRNSRDQGTVFFKDIYKRACMTSPESEKYWKFNSDDDEDAQNSLLFVPQVVVINLGTNDFSNATWAEKSHELTLTKKELDEKLIKEKIVEDSFVEEYFKMLSFLSQTYGRYLLASSSSSPLHVVLACGPMNTKMCDRILQQRILDVLSKLLSKNNESGAEHENILQKYVNVMSKYQVTFSLLKFDEMPDELVECGTHPNDIGAIKMSKIGTAHLRKIMKWN